MLVASSDIQFSVDYTIGTVNCMLMTSLELFVVF